MTHDSMDYIELRGEDGSWAKLEDMRSVRRFEGGETYSASLDGKPCFAVNELALADMGDDMAGWNFCPSTSSRPKANATNTQPDG